MILRGMASRFTSEISRALLNYSHNALQMWFSVYFLLLILIFSLFPLSLLQQARIHNLDLIKNRIQSYTCEQVKNQCQRNWGWGRFSERNTWNHFSKCSAKGLPNHEILHITILIVFEETYFLFFPTQAFLQGIWGQLLHSF